MLARHYLLGCYNASGVGKGGGGFYTYSTLTGYRKETFHLIDGAKRMLSSDLKEKIIFNNTKCLFANFYIFFKSIKIIFSFG